MGVIETSTAVGAALDAANGNDGIVDGAAKGAIVGLVLKIAAPVVVLGGLGFAAFKGIRYYRGRSEQPAAA